MTDKNKVKAIEITQNNLKSYLTNVLGFSAADIAKNKKKDLNIGFLDFIEVEEANKFVNDFLEKQGLSIQNSDDFIFTNVHNVGAPLFGRVDILSQILPEHSIFSVIDDRYIYTSFDLVSTKPCSQPLANTEIVIQPEILSESQGAIHRVRVEENLVKFNVDIEFKTKFSNLFPVDEECDCKLVIVESGTFTNIIVKYFETIIEEVVPKFLPEENLDDPFETKETEVRRFGKTKTGIRNGELVQDGKTQSPISTLFSSVVSPELTYTGGSKLSGQFPLDLLTDLPEGVLGGKAGKVVIEVDVYKAFNFSVVCCDEVTNPPGGMNFLICVPLKLVIKKEKNLAITIEDIKGKKLELRSNKPKVYYNLPK